MGEEMTAASALPGLVALKIAERADEYDRVALALVCTAFRDAVAQVVKKAGTEAALVTNLRRRRLLERAPRFTLGWFKWVHGWPERKEGAASYSVGERPGLYDSDLMGLAGFQGSVEALEWLRDQGIPLDARMWESGRMAAMGGHVDALVWLRDEGYNLSHRGSARAFAEEGGHAEVLRWLRRSQVVSHT